MAVTIKYPKSQAEEVMIAGTIPLCALELISGTFNDWQPESMQAVTDGTACIKELHKEHGNREEHRFKFVVNGQWTLQDGRPTTSDEHGNVNHKIVLEAHDHALNPTAAEFNPSSYSTPAAVQNISPFTSHTYPRRNNFEVPIQQLETHRRSRSRSKNAHSRTSSVASRHRSLSRHDELNPSATEFKPQFKEPSNHITHAQGYAAALKKAPSPAPSQQEFKQPRAPSRPASADNTHSRNESNANLQTPNTPLRPSSSEKTASSHPRKDNELINAPLNRALSSVNETVETTKANLASNTIQAKEIANARAEQVIQAASDVQQHASRAVEDLPDKVEASAKELKEVTETNVHDAQVALEDISNKAEKHIGTAVEIILDSTKNITTNISEGVVEAERNVRPQIQHVIETTSSTAEHAASVVHEESAKTATTIHDNLESISESATSLGQKIMDDTEHVLKTTSDTISEHAKIAAEYVKDLTSTAQPIGDRGLAINDTSTPISGSLQTVELQQAEYDAEQIRLMEEVCILLDRDDNVIGSATKKDSHLMTNINEGLLHRAFSLFIFNSNSELLLQQRADEKITFPNMWTNTCCSHPLSISGEVGNDLVSSVAGVKQAAQRKVLQELGIEPTDAPTEKMTFLTRIHYLAPSDGQWGEHEIDYILFLRSDPALRINPNEIRDHKWVSQEELRQLFAKPGDLQYTPWFKLICESFLYNWWDNLNNLSSCKDEQSIHRLGIEASFYDKIRHSESSTALNNTPSLASVAPVSIQADSEPAAEGPELDSIAPLEAQSDSQGINQKAAAVAIPPPQQVVIDVEAEPAAERTLNDDLTDGSVSRPSTGKRSIRPTPGFFAYIFNTLFGTIFRGFSTIWQKLAFWRQSPNRDSVR